MLVEKEVIRPGTYWYRDEATGLPRKLVVTPELTHYWHEQGNAMLSAGLTVPVPCEHDFDAHPMSPAEKLKNNAGWVKGYRLKGDALFGAVEVLDDDLAKKLPHTIRWTSPWINSFTDGAGKEWKNVISHLALTTRPRIIEQAPFSGIAAALSMATDVRSHGDNIDLGASGACLSRAGRLFTGKRDRRLRPRYPMAFSMWAGGIALGNFPPPKKDDLPDEELEADDDTGEGDGTSDAAGDPGADANANGIPDAMDPAAQMDPLADGSGDIAMEELLCDLLQALGVPMPDESNEQEFKRHLYEAVMSKIKELTSQGMGAAKDPGMQPPDQNQPPTQQPNASQPGKAKPQNPLIQQEQQPMFMSTDGGGQSRDGTKQERGRSTMMSLEDINKLPDPMRGVALSMHEENQRLRAEMEASRRVTNSLRDAKLKEAQVTRAGRINLLGRLSPRVKADLDAMLALPAMALSMGDGGVIIDPMAATLAVLEKGLGDLPRLLVTDASAMSVQGQPTDESMLTDGQVDDIADSLARQMGCPPLSQRAS